MQSYQGKSVYKGIAMGPVVVLKKNDYQVKRTRIEDPEAEIKRVDEALEKSKEQLQKLYDKAVQEVGEASAAIFEVHQMMLEDDDYLEAIQNTIRTEQINAEYAVAATGDNFAEMFASMDDDYMKARSADIKDISERLVRNLSGQDDADLSSIEPSIIVADDLSPSETVQMDKDKILAFVTVHGSTNSHTAILARMMNIPALIGVDMNLEEIHTGMEAVVDGFQGTVIFEPDETVKAQTTEKMAEEAEKLRLLQELKGKENVTLDGHKINIYANIGSVGDIGYVMENDAGGIGLFRSEFLYLGRNDFPTEEEQFQAYKQAVQMMAGKKVIIRTLDIGADKQFVMFRDGAVMGWIEQNIHCHGNFSSFINDSNQRFRLEIACSFRNAFANQLMGSFHGGNGHNLIAYRNMFGLGAVGQHGINGRNSNVGWADRLDIKTGENILSQRVKNSRDDFWNIEYFSGNLANHNVGVIIFGDGCDGITAFNACLAQNVKVDWHALNGEAGKVIRQQVKAFTFERDNGDIVANLAENIGKAGTNLSTSDD